MPVLTAKSKLSFDIICFVVFVTVVMIDFCLGNAPEGALVYNPQRLFIFRISLSDLNIKSKKMPASNSLPSKKACSFNATIMSAITFPFS
jgi:hypothetical protein